MSLQAAPAIEESITTRKWRGKYAKILLLFCLVFQESMFVYYTHLACTIIPADDCAFMLTRILYYSMVLNGIEIIACLLVKVFKLKFDPSNLVKALSNAK